MILQPNECNSIQITYITHSDEESSLFSFEKLDAYLLLTVVQQQNATTNEEEEEKVIKILLGLASEVDADY